MFLKRTSKDVPVNIMQYNETDIFGRVGASRGNAVIYHPILPIRLIVETKEIPRISSVLPELRGTVELEYSHTSVLP